MAIGTHRLLSVDEVAARLGLSEETIRRWLRSGKLRGVRLGERRTGWRVSERDLERLLQSGAR